VGWEENLGGMGVAGKPDFAGRMANVNRVNGKWVVMI